MFFNKVKDPDGFTPIEEDEEQLCTVSGSISGSDEIEEAMLGELDAGLRQVLVENHALKEIAQHPIINAIEKFREELQRFVMLKEDRQDPPHFGLKDTAPSIRDLRKATRAVCSRLESLSFGRASANLAVEERMLAKQVCDQLQSFHSYINDGIERRDHGVVQNAIKIKSFVSDVLLQFEAAAQNSAQPAEEAA